MNIYIPIGVVVSLVLTVIVIIAVVIYIRKNWPELTIRAVANQIENIPGLEKVRELCLLSVSGRLSLPGEMVMELVVMTLKNGNPYGIICDGIVLRQLRIAFPDKMDRVIRAFYENFLRKLNEKHWGKSLWPELPTKRELDELFLGYKMSDHKEQRKLQQILLGKLLGCILDEIHIEVWNSRNSLTEEKRNLAEWIISHCKSHILCGYQPRELTKKVLQFQRLTKTRIDSLQKLLDIKIA